VGLPNGAAVQDPATAPRSPASNAPGPGILPHDCAYRDSGDGVQASPKQPEIYCGGGADLSLEGFNLSTVGGHPCTAIVIANSATGTVSITNNFYQFDPSCAYSGALINAVNGGTANFVVSSNTFDERGPAYLPDKYATVSLLIGTSGDITISNNAFINAHCRWISMSMDGASPGRQRYEYNYFEGFETACPATDTHGEIVLATVQYPANNNVTINNISYSYNTILLTNNQQSGLGAGAIYMSTGFPPGMCCGAVVTYRNAVIDHNVIVTNWNGDLKVPPTGALIQWNYNYYTNMTVTNNYVDGSGTYIPRGIGLCTYAPFVGGQLVRHDTPFSGMLSVTGNINLITGAPQDSIAYTQTCKAPQRKILDR
jgi:hypothetical protein